MKVKTDIHRLCDGLSEEFYKDLDVTSPEDGDPERIKQIALNKIHQGEKGQEKEIEKPMKRISNKILIAVAMIAILTTTVFAAGGMDFFRSMFGDSIDQAGDNIQSMMITAEDENFKMSAEQLISDGLNTKIIVGLQPLTKEAKKWIANPRMQVDILAESEDQSVESMRMTGSERLSQFDTKEKAYFCVSYSSNEDYSGKPIHVTLTAIIPEGKEIEDAVVKPDLSLVIDEPESMRASKTVTFAEPEDSNTIWPASLTVNSISTVLVLQGPETNTDTVTLDVTLVMKDKTRESIFESGWVSEGSTGGGGVALGKPEELPLASEFSYRRDLETGKIIQTAGFSRILNVEDVDYVLVGDERFDFD